MSIVALLLCSYDIYIEETPCSLTSRDIWSDQFCISFEFLTFLGGTWGDFKGFRNVWYVIYGNRLTCPTMEQILRGGHQQHKWVPRQCVTCLPVTLSANWTENRQTVICIAIIGILGYFWDAQYSFGIDPNIEGV